MPGPDLKQQNKEDKDILSPLGEIELEACRMRFEGYMTPEIESILVSRYGDRAPKAKTVRSWFSRSGKLHDFYKSYATEETRFRHSLAQRIFQAHVHNAARTIVRIMNDPAQSAMVRFRAAQYIINRELGLPSKIAVADETKDPAVRILKAMGLIEK